MLYFYHKDLINGTPLVHCPSNMWSSCIRHSLWLLFVCNEDFSIYICDPLLYASLFQSCMSERKYSYHASNYLTRRDATVPRHVFPSCTSSPHLKNSSIQCSRHCECQTNCHTPHWNSYQGSFYPVITKKQICCHQTLYSKLTTIHWSSGTATDYQTTHHWTWIYCIWLFLICDLHKRDRRILTNFAVMMHCAGIEHNSKRKFW